MEELFEEVDNSRVIVQSLTGHLTQDIVLYTSDITKGFPSLSQGSLQCRCFLWASECFFLAKAPGYYFYSPQSSSVIKSKMAAITIRTWTSFRPPKIRLDCRLVPGQHYIMSGHLSGADWKEILRSAHHCTVVGRQVSPVRIASQTLDEERDCLDWRRCQDQLARTL